MEKKRFISFSGGVESTTMCLLYGKGSIAIFSDTGNEEPEMYERLDYVEQMMKVIHDGDFQLIRIKPNVKAKGKYYSTLQSLALAWGYFPGSGSRWCTPNLKIDPIDEFLSEQGQCLLMIGLNADEIHLREGNQSTLENVTYTTPLAEDGHTREDCVELLDEHGLNPNFPPYMSRGGCRLCFFRGKKEAKAKYFFNKSGFLEDMAFELKLNSEGTRKLNKSGIKKFFGINQAFKSYQSIIDECKQEIAMFGLEEMKAMYSNIPEHKACGLYCHR